MARGGTEIRNVIVNFPKNVQQEELERRACKAYAKILCNMYPPKVIDKVIEVLERR